LREHWLKFIADAERRCDHFLARIVRDPDSPDLGSVPGDWGGMSWGYPDPKPSLNMAACAISVYLNGESRFHGDPRIPEAVSLALGYAERSQNDDGTFDYRPCNFRSAPDTAFIVNRIVVTYDLIRKFGTDDALNEIEERIKGIIARAGRGMAKNGFHTPNHRWAIAAALSSCARISGDSSLLEAVDRYLAEGIDGNEYGEYAERSAGNYNMVNNDQMLILAAERRDPSFLAYVDRNLEMMLSYIEPDGSVFTNNSTRQDRGVKTWLDNYYCNYLEAAKLLGKPLYSAVAKKILSDIISTGRASPDYLDRIMLNAGGIDYGPCEIEIPNSYSKYYEESGIVRASRGDFSFSIVRDSGRFLYVRSGGLGAFLKMGVAYFDKREFMPSSIERVGKAYILKFLARGWYYLPLESPPATRDWWKMDNSKRRKTQGPDLDFSLRVEELPSRDGISVAMSVEGWPGVPLRLEVGLEPGCRVDGETFALEGRAGGAILAKGGRVVARREDDALEIGPAFAEHFDIGGTYGSEARSSDHFTVYFTALSPLEKTITFRRVMAVGY
jgi:hypothetical protein